MPPAVTGLGFVEALEDAALLALADPNDLNGDGISGRVNYVDPPDYFNPNSRHIPNNGQFIGRFGKKAAAINLQQQTVQAYRDDIGITTDFLSDDPFNVQVSVSAGDNVPEPELGSSVVEEVIFYIQTLKAPIRRDLDDPQVIQGEGLFLQVGCSDCHVTTLKTGFSEVKALNEIEFHPFSDFLLHDMGPELDDGYIDQGAAQDQQEKGLAHGVGSPMMAIWSRPFAMVSAEGT